MRPVRLSVWLCSCANYLRRGITFSRTRVRSSGRLREIMKVPTTTLIILLMCIRHWNKTLSPSFRFSCTHSLIHQHHCYYHHLLLFYFPPLYFAPRVTILIFFAFFTICRMCLLVLCLKRVRSSAEDDNFL